MTQASGVSIHSRALDAASFRTEPARIANPSGSEPAASAGITILTGRPILAVRPGATDTVTPIGVSPPATARQGANAERSMSGRFADTPRRISHVLASPAICSRAGRWRKPAPEEVGAGSTNAPR